jgi:hypothetical protein
MNTSSIHNDLINVTDWRHEAEQMRFLQIVVIKITVLYDVRSFGMLTDISVQLAASVYRTK